MCIFFKFNFSGLTKTIWECFEMKLLGKEGRRKFHRKKLPVDVSQKSTVNIFEKNGVTS